MLTDDLGPYQGKILVDDEVCEPQEVTKLTVRANGTSNESGGFGETQQNWQCIRTHKNQQPIIGVARNQLQEFS